MEKKNVLFIMCDQFRYDCISALGNSVIRTPNIDRLVESGVSFQNAYSTCPVCVPARYTIMTGREPNITGCYCNETPAPLDGQADNMEERCGPYLARYMTDQGYRTFGIGKFHTIPDCYEDLGFETHMHTEELWETAEIKKRDAYAAFIRKQFPEYGHLDQLHGERSNMYYVPQLSAFSAENTVEGFVARLTIEELNKMDPRPFFGFVSFIGPHPPCAPPVPYNLMYDPDVMSNPVHGDPATDAMDEQIDFMNYTIWADEINDAAARNIKSRYYGEISYIDACIGKILDNLEESGKRDNTVICFFADHGDHMGDHGAWQKETFFEASARVPFILCDPAASSRNTVTNDLVCLTDLFSIASTAAGFPETKDGSNWAAGERRQRVYGIYGRPGTRFFKIMIRSEKYKYIYMSNGGREQLFELARDRNESVNLTEQLPEVTELFQKEAFAYCQRDGLFAACAETRLKLFPFSSRPRKRIHQFEFSRGIDDFVVSSKNYFSSM